MMKFESAALSNGRRRSPQARARKASQGATRKAAVVKAQRKPSAWLNRLIILTGAGIVFAAATQAFLTLQAIPVEQITVTGELEHTQAAVIQELIQPSLVGGFLGADLQRIRVQLEDLPWIYRATVQRRWPNALEIHVVEQLPIARWGEHGFLNHEGELFQSDNAQDWSTLPRLQGPRGKTRALVAAYQRIIDILAPLHLSVAQLTVDERGQMDVVLSSGMQLSLGSENFLERMHRFVAIYRVELATRAAEVERVDLRYQSGIAVTFTESSRVAGI